MNPVLAAQRKYEAGLAAHDVTTRTVIHGDVQTFIRTQDCNAIADDAKARHNQGFHGSSEMKHAARLPHVIVEQYCNEQGVSFEEFMASPVHVARIVKDPKNDMFRIWKGNF
jgi:hypothetical protein